MAFGDFATLLSAFTGTDENPLSEDGNWALTNSSEIACRRLTNQVKSSGTGTGCSHWTPASFGPDCEAYFTIATKPASSQAVAVVARVQGEGGAGTWDGYRLLWTAVSGGANDTWSLNRMTNGVSAATIASGTQEFASGEKMGICCIGGTIQAWRFAGGAWALLGSGTDTTYPNAGKAGMRLQNTTVIVDDFFAGTIPANAIPPKCINPVQLIPVHFPNRW